jgi:hypothetical protein
MSKPILGATIIALALVLAPGLARAEPDAKTTAFFEKNKVAALDAAKTKAAVDGKTITFKHLADGTTEEVFYGGQRFDAKGGKSKYLINKNGISEEIDGTPRRLLLYVWQDHTYACLENVGDLDELDGAEGTCPYEIVKATSGNHLGGK